MTLPVVTLKDIELTFGGGALFESVDLSLYARDRVCLVGRNGTGKSTLMKLIAGHVAADRGTRWIQPGITLAYLPQEPDFSGFDTVLEAAQAGIPAEKLAYEGYRAAMLLDIFQLDPTADPGQLSGGQNHRLALTQAMAGEPDVLLLDEPTNHLDIAAISWLEEELRRFPGAIVFISHDRQFLRSLSKKTFWLESGKVRILDKGYSSFDEWSENILEQRVVEARKLDRLIKQETTWSRQGISARRKRNMGRVRRLQDLRQQKSAGSSAKKGELRLEIDSGNITGRRVLEAFSISKDFGQGPLIDDLSLKIARGDKIGLVGPNGVGKSTLIKLLMGELTPDSGRIKRGTNLELTYLDQRRSTLDPEKSLWETLADVGGDQIMVRGEPRHVVTYLREFLFHSRQALQPVGSLSGGERNRLLLAKSLAGASNFLVLDEPTNDLDMETLDLLQELLDDYKGTLLLVSHDRDFLDRVVLSTLWFEGGGKISQYAGGYSDALVQRELSGVQPGVQRDSSDARASRRKETGGKVGSGKVGSGTGKKSRVARVVGKEPSLEEGGKSFARKRKMTYARELRLEALPGKIAEAEKKIETCQSRLSEPDLYTKNPKAFIEISNNLQELQASLEAMETEWLGLDEMATAIRAINAESGNGEMG